MLKVIVFDFDYTLGDSTNGIVLSVNYALEQLGYIAKSVDEIKKTIGLSMKETYFCLTKNDDLKAAEQFAKLFKELNDYLEAAKIQGFRWKELHYEFGQGSGKPKLIIDVLLNETTYKILALRYKELQSGGGNGGAGA